MPAESFVVSQQVLDGFGDKLTEWANSLGLGDFRNTIQGIFKVGQALGSG